VTARITDDVSREMDIVLKAPRHTTQDSETVF
jgi:hypothetical protein